MTPEEKAAQVKTLSTQLLAEGRTDLLLKAISVPVLEQLRIEAARATLSPLVITEDYHSCSQTMETGKCSSVPSTRPSICSF